MIKRGIMKELIKKIFICVACFVLISCNKNKKVDFFSIPVNSSKSSELPLSKISEKIEVIELEVTDKSLISSVMDVLETDNYFIVRDKKSIMLFDKKGIFTCLIGSVGQGPGEYVNIIDMAVDSDNEKIYAYTNTRKIICYDFNGIFLKETPTEYYRSLRNICWVGGKLLAASEHVSNSSSLLHHILYNIDGDNLSITDSIKISELKSESIGASIYNDYISNEGNNTYFFFTDYSSQTNVLDTLYHIDNKKFEATPYLRLELNNNGYSIYGDKEIYMFNIYKSSRYVFAFYRKENLLNNFCYDTKTEIGYNLKSGYTDDIHTGEKVRIRPLDSDANKYYYTYTNVNETDKDEPNPTLYIGILKK